MNKKITAVVAVLLVFSSACSTAETNESETFESLLSLVETGEAKLESGIAMYSPAAESFLRCLDGGVFCENQRAKAEKQLDMTRALFDFQKLQSELFALRLTENKDANQARDAYVRHLRAWAENIQELRGSMPTADEISRQDFSFSQTWTQILEADEIRSTFDEVCGALGNAQPAGSDEFSARIIDICDD